MIRGVVLVLAAVALALDPESNASPDSGAAETAVVDPESIAQSTNAQALVAEAYGGTEALSAFPGFHAQGKVLSLTDGIGAAIEISLLLDGSMRTEVRYPSRKEVRILSGSLAWNGGGRVQSPSTRALKDATLLQYHRLAAPFEISILPPAELRPLGTSPEGWMRLRREWPSGLSMTYDIEHKTGFIRRTTARMGKGEDAGEFVTELDDFRKVSGNAGAVMFPFRAVTRVGQEAVSEVIFERLEERSKFSEVTFLPAGAAGDF
jgi:hypothetical protein